MTGEEMALVVLGGAALFGLRMLAECWLKRYGFMLRGQRPLTIALIWAVLAGAFLVAWVLDSLTAGLWVMSVALMVVCGWLVRRANRRQRKRTVVTLWN